MNFYEKHCEKYLRQYEKTESFFRADERRIKALKLFSKLSTYAVYAAYVFLLVYLAANKDMRIVRAVIVPAAAFLLVTAVRSGLNFPRPYEKYHL